MKRLALPALLTPEERLVLTILLQAAHELHCDKVGLVWNARRFVLSSDFDFYCWMVDIRPDYLRSEFARAGWLPARYLPDGEGIG